MDMHLHTPLLGNITHVPVQTYTHAYMKHHMHSTLQERRKTTHYKQTNIHVHVQICTCMYMYMYRHSIALNVYESNSH